MYVEFIPGLWRNNPKLHIIKDKQRLSIRVPSTILWQLFFSKQIISIYKLFKTIYILDIIFDSILP